MIRALLLVVVAALAAPAWAQKAPDGPAPYWQLVSYIYSYKAMGYLPEWAGLEDDIRFVVSTDGQRQLLCLRDRATGATGVTTGDLKKFIAGMQNPAAAMLDLWERGPPGPVLPVDRATCFPPPPTPVALGEPVYRAIVHTRPDRDAPLDWAAMAKMTLGQSIAGSPCRTRLDEPTEVPDPTVGWYTAPGGGITRCRAPG